MPKPFAAANPAALPETTMPSERQVPERVLKHIAMQVAVLLPYDADDARRVLAHVDELLDGYLGAGEALNG